MTTQIVLNPRWQHAASFTQRSRPPTSLEYQHPIAKTTEGSPKLRLDEGASRQPLPWRRGYLPQAIPGQPDLVSYYALPQPLEP